MNLRSKTVIFKMGIILFGLIVISTVYLIRWLVSKFENWSGRFENHSSQFQLIKAFKVVAIITIAIVALGASFAAATFNYSILFK
jgi:hypothetical protein